MRKNSRIYYGKQMIIGKRIINGQPSSSFSSLFCFNLERWSVTKFSTLFLSQISRSNISKKKNPSYQSWLGNLLIEEILNSRMVGIHNNFRASYVWPKFFNIKYYRKQFFFSCSIIHLSFIQSPTRIVNSINLFFLPSS